MFWAILAAAALPSAVPAQCSPPDPQLSPEAQSILTSRNLERIQATAEIDFRASQRILGLLFDLKTGKPKVLPDKLRQKYELDIKTWAQILRMEAAQLESRSEAVLEHARSGLPCYDPSDIAKSTEAETP